MNIALLHYSAPPIVGGVESVLAHHARLMTEAGHTVRLIAARGAQSDARIPFISIPWVDSRHGALTRLKAELDAGRVPSDFEETVHRIEAALREALTGVEIVIAHNVCSLNKNLALTAALHTLAREVRLMAWHHDLAWTTPRYRPELHEGYPWDLLRTAWPNVTQVVVSALRQTELAALMHIPAESVHVVPNGLDLARFHKLEPQTQTLIAQTGLLRAAPILLLPVRITPRKNIELALRVLASLTPRPPLPRGEGEEQLLPSLIRRGVGGEGKPALVVTGPLGPHSAGNDQYFARLKTLRAELGLEASAHFLTELNGEMLPDAVIADFFRLADALLLPSREEGFGIPVLEAAFSRLPVFCADIPPLRALGGEAATYFSPDADPAHVAHLIAQRLHTDRAYQLSVQLRNEFTWENVYARHIAPLLSQSS
jgi:glycosyltransferase involved in cell wall biosynthesis